MTEATGGPEPSIEEAGSGHDPGVRQPEVLVPVWWLLGLLCLVEALHEVFGVGSPDAVFGLGLQGFLQVAATIVCLARAA
jgi:hypothetical protein